MLFTRRWRQAALVIPAAVAVLACTASAARPPLGHLLLSGIRADPAAPGGICPLPASGAPRCPADPGDPAGAGQRWLASGSIPGVTPGQRVMATQALLGIRLLTQPDGAVAAAWYPGWKYAWPRDSSWAAAALTATGHGGAALAILRFIARMQLPSGIWAARYQLDGAGPVRDGRPDELDANGWFPWAAWFWYQAQARSATTRAAAGRGLAALWPAVRRAAGATIARLGLDGLPPVSMDYWEDRVTAVTIGIAAPLYAGLRAAADLARALGDGGDTRRWTAAAHRLGAAIQARFGATGYQRTPAAGSGADAAVTFLGPPFTPATPGVRRAVTAAAAALTLANGGIQPGQAWPGSPGEAWTPETAFFALYDAASGDRAGARHWLSWLAAHRTASAALPEQVNAAGQPASVAPLAWTDAITVLAMTAERAPLPVP